ncbi:DUF11 domain-containing protein [Chryseobacterium sp. FH1]|uniref:DUF11 domain-containing protein n=1 Tax=Chryseobacterium sp. FH1 TaxID=1233951 RepID=UPI0004E42452|nr:DUF11 domain-containing protein [Chryseobacterium sp. FH1]KFC20187.1 hypothetical protein IO90_13420 [Chryseobacterium sp. FH1]
MINFYFKHFKHFKHFKCLTLKLCKVIPMLLLGINFYAQVDIGTNLIGPLSIEPGSPLSYTLLVTNNGSTTASNVNIKFPVASNFTATGITCTAGAGTGGSASCPNSLTLTGLQGTGLVIPILPEGSGITFTISGTSGNTPETIVTNTATVEHPGDSNTTNNNSSISTGIFVTPCATTTYKLDVNATLALPSNVVGINGGNVNLVYALASGVAIPGIGNSFTLPLAYSDLNNQYGVDNRWQALTQGSSSTLGRSGLMLVPRTDGVGSLYNSLPANNSTSETDLSFNNTDNVFTTKIEDGSLNQLGRFAIEIGNYPTAPGVSKIVSHQYVNWNTGNLRPVTSGWWLKPHGNTQIFTSSAGSPTVPIGMQPGQTYTFRYSAFGDGSATNSYPDSPRGLILGDSQNVVTYGYDDSPVISSISPVTQTVPTGVSPTAITVTASKFNTNSPLLYQWYSNTINSNINGTLISGANSASYTPPAPTGSNTTYYYVVIKGDGICSTISSVTRVSVGSCYKPGSTTGEVLETKIGISSLGRAGDDANNWPMVRKGGWLALESKSKGFVLNRVPFSDVDNNPATPDVPVNISSANFIEGMMVYDITNKCMKLYTSADNGNTFGWYCITTQACPDLQQFSLDCSDVIINGDTHLDPNVNFTISIPYYNGDGSSYSQQSFSSTGTNGLTAVLAAGSLSNGNGNLILTVSGNSTYGGGGYYFPISLNGKECTILVNVTADPGETKNINF